MGLTLSFTFTAGTKAKSAEVNANFSDVVAFVDTLEANIATNTADISVLQAGKADKNGNTANRFAMADPVANNDGINKKTLLNKINNSLGYVNGLVVTKDSNDTVAVSAGACYDSTALVPMVFTSGTKQNATQSASTNYYVYLIKKETEVYDILISTDNSTPSLPADYVYFKRLASYRTDADSNIYFINQDNAPIGTRLWISDEQDITSGADTSVVHGLTLDPLSARAEVFLKCKEAEFGYTVDEIVTCFGATYGSYSAFVGTLSPSPTLTSSNISYKTGLAGGGINGLLVLNKNDASREYPTLSKWKYIFKITY